MTASIDPTISETPSPSWRGPFRALAHRNYRLFFAGQTLSLLGTWIQITALAWLAHDLTGTSRWPARIVAAQMVPAFFLGAWGGVIADRRSKRNVLLITQSILMALALFLAVSVLTGAVTIWHLLAIATATGLVNAVDFPTRLSFVVDMVGKQDLVNAVALNSLGFNVARTLGPMLAGLVLYFWGVGWCFLLNTFTFLAVLAGLSQMKIDRPKQPAQRDPVLRSLLGGLRYVIQHPRLRILLPMIGAVAFFGWPLLSLLPAVARQLGAPKQGQSWMLSGIGCGALTAAFLVAWHGSWQRRRWFLTIGILTASAGLVELSMARQMTGALLCCGLVGLGLVTFFATSQSIVQLSAADEYRGRVMAVYTVILSGANPAGQLIIGEGADAMGEGRVILIQGAAVLAVGMLALVATLAFRAKQSANV